LRRDLRCDLAMMAREQAGRLEVDLA